MIAKHSDFCRGIYFGPSNKGPERRGDPIHYLQSLSVLIISDSYSIHGLKIFCSFELRQKKSFELKIFRHGFLTKLYVE